MLTRLPESAGRYGMGLSIKTLRRRYCALVKMRKMREKL